MPDFEKGDKGENNQEAPVEQTLAETPVAEFQGESAELTELKASDELSSENRAQEILGELKGEDFSEEKFEDMLDYIGSGTLLTGEAEATPEYKVARAFLILRKAMQSNPDWSNGQFDGKQEAKEVMESLSVSQQENLATKFFENTFSESLSGGRLRGAYNVYVGLKGTAFSSKFAQLEDSRLKEGGFGSFSL